MCFNFVHGISLYDWRNCIYICLNCSRELSNFASAGWTNEWMNEWNVTCHTEYVYMNSVVYHLLIEYGMGNGNNIISFWNPFLFSSSFFLLISFWFVCDASRALRNEFYAFAIFFFFWSIDHTILYFEFHRIVRAELISETMELSVLVCYPRVWKNF